MVALFRRRTLDPTVCPTDAVERNPDTLDSTIAGWWPGYLDGQGRLADVTEQNPGTLVGGPTMVSGPRGPAMSFSGQLTSSVSPQYITTPLVPPLSGTLMWQQSNSIAYNNNTNSVAVWGALTGGTAAPEFTFQKYKTGTLYIGWNGFSGDTRLSLAATAQNWPTGLTDYAVTWVNGGATTLYVNNVQVATRTGTAAGAISGTFTIGNIGSAFTTTSYYAFGGTLSNFRMLSRALAPGEIADLSAAPFAGLR